MRKLCLVLVLVSSIFLSGCGSGNLIAGFKIGFAASRPFVQSLVQSGTITQAKADAVIGEINAGVGVAERGEACLREITVTGSAKKVAQGKCYFAVAQDLRVILARHNIGGNPRLDQISLIVAGAIEAFEAYFASVNPDADGGTSRALSSTAVQDPDKQLETRLKELQKQLKNVTGN